MVNILLASSEVAPFAKTGGLADVCGSLPVELARLGHDPTVILPAYRSTRRCRQPIEPTDLRFEIPIGGKIVAGRLLRSCLPDAHVPVYLVEQDEYYDRADLYRENGKDYKDNCERFVFFCRAVLESIRLLNLPVEVLHCNDWHTALIPAYLQIEYHQAPNYGHIGSLLTIHNMAFQGQFWHWDMLLTGLDWKYFNWREMEFYGQLNLLKTGIVFADAINTVSPTYAREIQSHPLGCGMEGVLQQRRDVLTGILNGVNYHQWNPAADPHLPQRYDVHDWRAGKAQCKAALQTELGLQGDADTPLIGMIGRLADQKGWDLISQIIPQWIRRQTAQWVILGTGEPRYHQLLLRLAAECPDRVVLKLEFSEPLAHRIEAAADIFLVPSLFEPCGLNQLYSLRYGAVPVVHATGGLRDSIVHASSANLAAGLANGYAFETYTAEGLETTLQDAVAAWRDHPEVWRQLVESGMKQDWSWSASARRYIELYEEMIARKSAAAAK